MVIDARIDAYLQPLPADQREVLQRLREDVQRLVPEGEETIAYDMPAFRLDGRFLLSFAAWKRHCSIYPIDDAVLERHAAFVRGYNRTRGALHFSAARPLPAEVLRDLVELRVGEIRGRSGAA